MRKFFFLLSCLFFTVIHTDEQKKVVYTCICGNYDGLIVHSYVRNDWDYICFTDNQELLENGHTLWTIRPLQFSSMDNTRNNRWHKLFPNKILQEYDISLYVDGNINVLAPNVFDYVDDVQESLAVHDHPYCTCIYEHAEECKRMKKDDPAIIDKQLSILRELHYPEGNGLKENNMIYRVHHDGRVIEVMEEWWQWISNYSRRDQLSFDYVVWHQDFKVHSFKETFVWNPQYAKVVSHAPK